MTFTSYWSSLPNEAVDFIHLFCCYALLMAGVAAFLTLFFISAPYGRFSASRGWGPLINPKLAWFLWESPALVLPSLAISSSSQGAFSSLIDNPLAPRTLLYLCITTHYCYRVLIYPFLTRGGKPAPLSVCILSFSFCVWNGFLQGYYIAYQLPPSSSDPPTFTLFAGCSIWFIGWISVIVCDVTLIQLRKPGEQGYQIPRGGLFEFVSAANYSSEIFEWTGYALASGGALPCVSFAAFTFFNLVPRGVAHHKFYRSKFEYYPRGRKAVIPWLW